MAWFYDSAPLKHTFEIITTEKDDFRRLLTNDLNKEFRWVAEQPWYSSRQYLFETPSLLTTTPTLNRGGKNLNSNS
jgi:hypothetical protein